MTNSVSESDYGDNESLDQLLRSHSLLDQIIDDSDLQASKPTRATLWSLLKRCYQTVCALSTAPVAATRPTSSEDPTTGH